MDSNGKEEDKNFRKMRKSNYDIVLFFDKDTE